MEKLLDAHLYVPHLNRWYSCAVRADYRYHKAVAAGQYGPPEPAGCTLDDAHLVDMPVEKLWRDYTDYLSRQGIRLSEVMIDDGRPEVEIDSVLGIGRRYAPLMLTYYRADEAHDLWLLQTSQLNNDDVRQMIEDSLNG